MLLHLLKWGLIIIAILYIGLFSYFSFGWTNHYPKKQIDLIISDIKKAPTLNYQFYSLYDKACNDRHEKITNRFFRNFWSEFIVMPRPIQNNWEFVAANITPYKGFHYKIAPMTLAFKINKSVSPEKCFDYVMTEMYRGFSKEFKLNDSIINLKDTATMIKFIVAKSNPRFYRVHPTQYKLETDSLTNLLLFKATTKAATNIRFAARLADE